MSTDANDLPIVPAGDSVEALARRLADTAAQLEASKRRLQECEARFRSLTEMSSDFYWESDSEHRLTRRTSPELKLSTVSLFRHGAQLGMRRWDIPYLSPDEVGWQAHRAILDAHRPFRDFQLSRLGVDGTERFISISGEPVFDATGAFKGYRGVGTDITERKRLDASLKARETLLNDMGHMAAVGGWEFDLVPARDSWTELKQVWTEEIYRILEVDRNYSPTVGKGIGFYTPASRPVIEAAVRGAIADGTPFDVELDLITAKGNLRWVHAIGKADRALGKIRGTFQDITERKQQQQELVRREQLLQTIVDHIPVLICYVNPAGKVEWVNRCWERMLGWTLAESRERDIGAELYPDADYRREVMRFIAAGTGTWAAFRTRTKDGRTLDTRWANILLPDGTSIGIGEDVTERKRNEQGLIEAEERMQTVFEAAPLAVVTLDRTGIVTSWNPAAERMFGWNSNEAVGRLMPTVSIDQQDQFISLLQPEFEGNSYDGIELIRRKKDGSPIAIKLWTAPLRNSGGEITNVVGLFEDLTERNLHEQVLRESEEQLRQVRFERERLSRDLHDGIVQDLYAIGLGLENVGRLVTADAGKAKTGVYDAVEALNHVIRAVRQHIVGLERGAVAAEQLHAELQALMRTATAAHAMRFELHASRLALLRLPPSAAHEIIHIVHEAVSNSLRHSGGRRGVVTLTEHDDRVLLTIEDDGTGFDVLKRRGSGLGLHNIAARAQALHAALDIRSSPGRGTRIVLDLPMAPVHAMDQVSVAK